MLRNVELKSLGDSRVLFLFIPVSFIVCVCVPFLKLCKAHQGSSFARIQLNCYNPLNCNEFIWILSCRNPQEAQWLQLFASASLPERKTSPSRRRELYSCYAPWRSMYLCPHRIIKYLEPKVCLSNYVGKWRRRGSGKVESGCTVLWVIGVLLVFSTPWERRGLVVGAKRILGRKQ